MTFGDKYDKTLWIILNGDRKNRDKLVDFINSLTDEMYRYIRLFIKDYNEYENISSYRQITSDGLNFLVEIHADELIIALYKWDDLEERYELTLVPFGNDVLSKDFIGRFEYKVNRLDDITIEKNDPIEEVDVEYYLSRNIFGYYLETNAPNRGDIYSVKRVNINKMPERIYPHYFSSKKRLNRLVRRKTR